MSFLGHVARLRLFSMEDYQMKHLITSMTELTIYASIIHTYVLLVPVGGRGVVMLQVLTVMPKRFRAP
jgi:hypothetical protein